MSHCKFKHGVAVDERLLGKNVPIVFEYNGSLLRGQILFPKITRKDDCKGGTFYKIISPTSFAEYSYSGIDNWGEVKTHIKKGNITYILPVIFGVAFVLTLDGNEIATVILNNILRKYAIKFFTVLLFKHQESFIDEFKMDNDFVEIFGGINNRATIELKTQMYSTSTIERIKVYKEEFFYILRNIEKDLNLQYELESEMHKSFLEKVQ